MKHTAPDSMRIVFFGLSLSSSWGNGHATTFRALLKGLHERGHEVIFLERTKPWYTSNRDLVSPSFCRLEFYDEIEELSRLRDLVASADAVIVGSFVPDGDEVSAFVQQHARGVRAFYDIDTPVTLAKLDSGACDYLSPGLIPGFDVYYSFTGGPILRRLEHEYGARAAEALFCAVDPDLYRPVDTRRRWDLGYLGTYSDDRQPTLERLLLQPARLAPELRFVVAGPLYPETIAWPDNVERIEHVGPADHSEFYGACRYTLNVTRADMRAAGYSPSVRLFEAAACGSPMLSDCWPGLDAILAPGREIELVETSAGVLSVLRGWSEARRAAMAAKARRAVLRDHTGLQRARQLEDSLLAHGARKRSRSRSVIAPRERVTT